MRNHRLTCPLKSPAQGFTLLEVLVALAVLSMLLVALNQAFSATVQVHGVTRDTWKAMQQVHNTLAQWERLEGVVLQVDQGEFESDHPLYGGRWELEVSDASPFPGASLYKVSYRVFWMDGVVERHYGSEVYAIP